MLSVTPMLLLIAGGFTSLVGFVFLNSFFGSFIGPNILIISAIFLVGAAITDTLNRLAKVLAGEKERERRADISTNVLVGLIAPLSVVVLFVFGLIIGKAMYGPKGSDGKRKNQQQQGREYGEEFPW